MSWKHKFLLLIILNKTNVCGVRVERSSELYFFLFWSRSRSQTGLEFGVGVGSRSRKEPFFQFWSWNRGKISSDTGVVLGSRSRIGETSKSELDVGVEKKIVSFSILDLESELKLNIFRNWSRSRKSDLSRFRGQCLRRQSESIRFESWSLKKNRFRISELHMTKMNSLR